MTRPDVWSFLKRRRKRRAERDEPAATAPEPAAEVEDDDLFRRVSDVAWRTLVIGVVVALLLWGLAYISVISIPVILAVFLTALLMPATARLRRMGLGRGSSTAITSVGALLVFGGVVTLVVQPALTGFGGLVDSVGQAIDSLSAIATSLGLQPALVEQIVGAADAELSTLLAENRDQLMTGVWTAGTAVLEALLGIILVLVLTVYFLHSGDRLVEWLSGLFPPASRHPMRAAGELAYGVMGRYVRGVATVGFIDAIGIGLALFFLIEPNLAIPLIVLTFIGAFLPIVGAFVSGLLATLVAFVSEGPLVALLVLGAVLVVQQLESHIFAPRVYGRALDLPAAVVLIAISAGGIIGGIAGMFLATPVAAVLSALLRDRPFSRDGRAEVEGASAAPSVSGATAAPAPGPGEGNGAAARSDQQERAQGARP